MFMSCYLYKFLRFYVSQTKKQACLAKSALNSIGLLQGLPQGLKSSL